MVKIRIIIPVLILLTLAIRFLPFFYYGNHPLGYDTGFYRHYLIADPNSDQSLDLFGKSAIAMKLFLKILKLTQLPPDVLLYGGYLLSIALVGLALYIFTKRNFGLSAGLFSLFLFAISPIEYTTYWFMLWKNALGTALLLTTFYLIEKRSWWALLSALIIFGTQTTTSVILSLTLFLHFILFELQNSIKTAFIFNSSPRIGEVRTGRDLVSTTPSPSCSKRGIKIRKRDIYLFFIFIGSGFVFIITQWPIHLNHFLNAEAIFLNTGEFLRLNAFLFPLALIGLLFNYQEIRKSILLPFALIALSFPIFTLPFYQRILPFVDLVILIFAGIGIKTLIQYAAGQSRFYKIFIFTLIGWLVLATFIQTTAQIKNLRPLVSKEAIKQLELLNVILPKNANILTSTDLAPWVYGWSTYKIFAPGLLNNLYNEPAWQKFWSTAGKEKRVEFLSVYPKPLYFFIDENSLPTFSPSPECVGKLSEFIYEYKC